MKVQQALKKIVQSLKWAAPILDVILSPLTVLATLWFRLARYWGVKNHKIMQATFLKLGMFPIVSHYYEPLFDYRKLPSANKKKANYLDFRDSEQLILLSKLNYGAELQKIPLTGTSNLKYYYQNGSFPTGDAELYYSIIRKFKPNKILEVGSGFSTLMAIEAIEKNKKEDPLYKHKLICIEPYEMPQLEKLNIELIRNKVEDIGEEYFHQLEKGDILFIDSSHIIRPGGDVNYLILKILPVLQPGVWVHFHDIFTPYEYPEAWLREEYRMWNEQFLLEAFLLGNNSYEIIISLNYLKHKYWDEVSKSLPMLGLDKSREPGSFWIRRK